MRINTFLSSLMRHKPSLSFRKTIRCNVKQSKTQKSSKKIWDCAQKEQKQKRIGMKKLCDGVKGHVWFIFIQFLLLQPSSLNVSHNLHYFFLRLLYYFYIFLSDFLPSPPLRQNGYDDNNFVKIALNDVMIKMNEGNTTDTQLEEIIVKENLIHDFS